MNGHDTQHDRVLAMLEGGPVCSTTFLEHRIPRAAGRVYELRGEGYVVQTRPCSRPGHAHRKRSPQIEYVLVRQVRQLVMEVS